MDDDPESLSKRKGMPYVDYNNECNVELIIYTFYVIYLIYIISSS